MRSFAIQLLLTLLLIGAASFVTTRIGIIPSRWNLLWTAGIPVAVALVFNHDIRRRILMVILLIAWSFVSIFITVWAFGLAG